MTTIKELHKSLADWSYFSSISKVSIPSRMERLIEIFKPVVDAQQLQYITGLTKKLQDGIAGLDDGYHFWSFSCTPFMGFEFIPNNLSTTDDQFGHYLELGFMLCHRVVRRYSADVIKRADNDALIKVYVGPFNFNSN